uniref:Medium-chain acyl-CoA ligase ACSF2, mitochondrial n=1 Tax=Syphacia muris TaxID=451379 RepID=A0A0N5AX23_9BILA
MQLENEEDLVTATGTLNVPDSNFQHIITQSSGNDTNAVVAATRKSYLHGISDSPLLFDTVGDRLRLAATVAPDREYAIFKRSGVRKTYRELLYDSERLAAGLLHIGLSKGDRIGMWSPNIYEWIVCQFGTAMVGMIMVNINPMYQSEELKFALEKVGIKALIAPPSFKRSNYYESICTVIPELLTQSEGGGEISVNDFPNFRHLILVDTEDSKPRRGAWRYSEIINMATKEDYMNLQKISRSVQPDDPVNIQYTSGTTGEPKGATLTHHNVVNNAYFVGKRAGYSEKRSIICIPNPLYHCFGCVMGTLCACIHFQTCVFPAPSFEPLAALQAIEEEKCTNIYGTPTMFIDMLNHPQFKQYNYSTICAGIVAGSPCPVALCRRLVTELGMQGLQVCYGTTETSPVSFMSKCTDPPEERIKTVGHIMDHLEAAVVSADGTILPICERGEILIRGYSVMRGYWDADEHTNAEITPDRWYHTGDLGIMHEDGSLSIVGRKKDMIVRGGENIYPTEIEQYLFRHPHIKNVQVVGVPDERFGEVVCAWISLKDGSPDLTEEDIRNFCKSKIAHFKIPRYVLFKKEHEFPLTLSGKVKKYRIREAATLELGLQNVESHFNAA